MPYTVTKLITNAYYISGIVSREFQTVTGNQIEAGFDCLNDLLGEKATDRAMIPYYAEYSFPAVVGQETYFVPDLIEAETLTFVLNDVRYGMNKMGRDRYQGSSRANNVESFPFNWIDERTLGGANISLYFKPNQAYEMTLWGLFRLAQVSSLQQDLELTTDRFYISYLKYELAHRLCVDFQYSIPEELKDQLKKLRYDISNSSAVLDLRLKKRTTLDPKRSTINYAIANFGGWMP